MCYAHPKLYPRVHQVHNPAVKSTSNVVAHQNIEPIHVDDGIVNIVKFRILIFPENR